VVGGTADFGLSVSLAASRSGVLWYSVPVVLLPTGTGTAVLSILLPVGRLVELDSLYLDGSVRRWLRIWVSGPFVGLAGLMPHFWCPVPV